MDGGKTLVNRKLVVTIMIIASVMFCGYFGMNYAKARDGQETLAFQIADASQTLADLPELPQDLEDLEERVAEAQERLDAEKSAFPSEVNSIKVVDAILELADECDVEAVPLITQPRAAVEVGEHEYRALRLSVTIEGSLAQLLAFVGKLERNEFETLIVERLEVDRGSEESEETTPVIATLELAIYTHYLNAE